MRAAAHVLYPGWSPAALKGKLRFFAAWLRHRAGLQAFFSRPENRALAAELQVRPELLGFAVWERRNGTGRNVTFPARTYSVNGERRSFSLLRWIAKRNAQERLEDLVLQAYADHMRESSRSKPH